MSLPQLPMTLHNILGIGRGEVICCRGVAIKYIFSLTKLVYFDISYPNNIYLATVKKSICQKLVEIGKPKYIHLFNRYIPYYFDTFDLLNTTI